jgi:hypothetical protein
MSQNASYLKIEDLSDVEHCIISKLKRAGIDSIHELAVSVPNELVMDKGIGDDVLAMSKLVAKARMSLIDSGLLVKEFCAEIIPTSIPSLVRRGLFTRPSQSVIPLIVSSISSKVIYSI